MKKINLAIFTLCALFIFLPVSYASMGSYYETKEGKYILCVGPTDDCIEVVKGQDGVTFDLNHKVISANGNTFYYDEDKQEDYNETLAGKTRMYYYKNKSDNYVLCATEKSCKTYTFDRLTSLGAVINHPTSISFNNGNGLGEDGDVYYFSQEQQNLYNEKNNSSGGTETGNSGGTTPETTNESCTRLKEPLKFIGNIVLIAKIAIPIVIIIFGMLDFFKAITGSKDEEIKKSFKSLIFRCLSGVVIFLLPTIVSVIFSLIDSWADIKGEFNYCQKCVLNVSKCK